MPPAGFEPVYSADERPQTYALDRAVTGIGYFGVIRYKSFLWHQTCRLLFL